MSTRVGAPPDHTVLGARLAQRTSPVAPDDGAYGYAHAHLSEALGQPLLQLQQAFDPVDAAPFETMLDPQRCPAWALPWLAQLVGITLPTSVPEADARQIIVELAGHKRGTTATLRAAAGLYLTGTKTVYFRERDEHPYHLEVLTLTDETPNPTAVLKALTAQKPAGIVLEYRNVRGWDYEQLTATGPDPYSALAAAFTNYSDLQEG